MRALAFDRFDNVGVLNARLFRRTSRDYGDHVRVSETLGNSGADIGLATGLHRFVTPVFLRREIAGIGVE